MCSFNRYLINLFKEINRVNDFNSIKEISRLRKEVNILLSKE